MGEFFPKFWENTKFFPNFSDKFVPKIGESPNLSSNFGTNSSPNLVNPQISPQLSGQIRPQIWWFPKFVLKFGENFFPKFGESPNLSPNFGTNSSPNLGNPQICPQISGQIRPQICPQKAREHTSNLPKYISSNRTYHKIGLIYVYSNSQSICNIRYIFYNFVTEIKCLVSDLVAVFLVTTAASGSPEKKLTFPKKRLDMKIFSFIF